MPATETKRPRATRLGGVSDEHNPLIPAGYDLAWSAVTVAVIVLAIAALVLLARSAKRLTPRQALTWTLVILLVPFVGSLAWLTIGRRSLPERSG